MTKKKQFLIVAISASLSVFLVAFIAWATTTVGNNVSVGGNLNISGNSTTTGNQVVSGTLTVTGTSTLATTTIANLSLTTPLDISSDTNLSVTATGIELSGDAIALTTNYTIPLTASTTDWETAYSERRQWDGGSTNLVAATGRASLGLGSMALEANTGTTTITTLGTITTGTWNGTAIDVTHGGTGLTSITQGQTLYASANNTLAATSNLFIDTSGNVGVGTTTISGDLQVWDNASSTVYIGDATHSGCIVMGDSDNSGVTYITVNNGVLTATTTKPAICK